MNCYTSIVPQKRAEELIRLGCLGYATYAEAFDWFIDNGLSIEVSRSQTMDGWSVIITEIETKVWRVIGHWENWSDAADKALVYAIKLLKERQK